MNQRRRAIPRRRLAKHRPRLAQRLPLPNRRDTRSKVLCKVGKGHCESAADTNRPQQSIDRIQPTLRRVLRELLDDSLRELREKMVVRRPLDPPPPLCRSGDTLFLIQKENVQV